MAQRLDYLFYLTIIGDTGTGKSNFLKRLALNLTYDWDNTFKPTIGIDFSIFYAPIDQSVVKLLIWDTSSNPNHQHIIASRVRASHGFFIVYDITNRKTFEGVMKWIKMAKETSWTDATMILIGNKSDLEEDREVSFEEGRLLAEELGMKFVETSVKRNENIRYITKWLMEKEIEKEKRKQKERNQKKSLLGLQAGKTFSSLTNGSFHRKWVYIGLLSFVTFYFILFFLWKKIT